MDVPTLVAGLDYNRTRLLGAKEKYPELVRDYAGGSTPSDARIPSVQTIRQTLETTYADFKGHIQQLTTADLDRRVGPAGKEQPIASRLLLLAWHEAHHQGQIHLTWNLYKAAHGIA
jgi:uncharacterized damage-inducible protein DinB